MEDMFLGVFIFSVCLHGNGTWLIVFSSVHIYFFNYVLFRVHSIFSGPSTGLLVINFVK